MKKINIYLLLIALCSTGCSRDVALPNGRDAQSCKSEEVKFLEKVKIHLKDGGDIDAIGDDGQTLLHEAVYACYVSAVEYLLSKRANPNIRNLYTLTPLKSAVQTERKEIVLMLLKAGANPNLDFPLVYACQSGQIEMAKLLLANGADINAPEPIVGWSHSPLEISSRFGKYDVVRFLVEHGARTTDRNQDDCNPATVAAMGGYREIVEYLLSKGSEKDVLIAAAVGDMQYLRKHIRRDNVDEGKYDCTPLVCAVSCGQTEVAKFLLDMGAEVNLRNLRSFVWLYNPERGQNLLEYAAERGDTKTADVLLAHGAPGKQDALIQSILCGKPEMVTYFIDHGGDLNGVYTGMHLLGLASRVGNLEIVKLLIAKKADVNARCSGTSQDGKIGYELFRNRTALSLCAQEDPPSLDFYPYPYPSRKETGDYLGVAKYLLEHGADPSLVDLSEVREPSLKELIKNRK